MLLKSRTMIQWFQDSRCWLGPTWQVYERKRTYLVSRFFSFRNYICKRCTAYCRLSTDPKRGSDPATWHQAERQRRLSLHIVHGRVSEPDKQNRLWAKRRFLRWVWHGDIGGDSKLIAKLYMRRRITKIMKDKKKNYKRK